MEVISLLMADNAGTTAEALISKTKQEIITEAKRIEEDLLYSAKGHFAASQIWSNWHWAFGIPLVILSALAASPWIKGLDKADFWALAIPTAVLVVSAVITFVRPSEQASNHLKAGNEYDSLMNETRIFRTIQCSGPDEDSVLTAKVKDLSTAKIALNSKSPQIPTLAYWIARRGIAKGEAKHGADDAKPA